MFGIFKKKSSSEFEVMAENLYEVLVISPPSSGDENSLGPSELEIGINNLAKFTAKRTLMLEATLHLATVVALDGNAVHPLLKAVDAKIAKHWLDRGLISSIDTKIHDLCFKEVEKILENPMKWSRDWLNEFYVGGEYDGLPGGPHSYTWGEQCHKEYQAMVGLIESLKNNGF